MSEQRQNWYKSLGVCPKWGPLGHNWQVYRGSIPWRLYRSCTGCGREERIK